MSRGVPLQLKRRLRGAVGLNGCARIGVGEAGSGEHGQTRIQQGLDVGSAGTAAGGPERRERMGSASGLITTTARETAPARGAAMAADVVDISTPSASRAMPSPRAGPATKGAPPDGRPGRVRRQRSKPCITCCQMSLLGHWLGGRALAPAITPDARSVSRSPYRSSRKPSPPAET